MTCFYNEMKRNVCSCFVSICSYTSDSCQTHLFKSTHTYMQLVTCLDLDYLLYSFHCILYFSFVVYVLFFCSAPWNRVSYTRQMAHIIIFISKVYWHTTINIFIKHFCMGGGKYHAFTTVSLYLRWYMYMYMHTYPNRPLQFKINS